ncbi:MAG: helix-turn-helix domain-containing protein [Bacteriovoracaceae bacterium]
MTTNKSNYTEAERTIQISPGEMVKHLREAKEWTQDDLSSYTGIAKIEINAIENDEIEVEKQLSIQLAKALNVHPASIMYADYFEQILNDLE